MPDKQVILSEEDLLNLEASKREREQRLEQLATCETGHDTRHYYGWLHDIDALCATVRALRAELAQAYYEDCEVCEQVIISENGDKVYTFIVCGRCWNNLQARLKEVEGERDDAQRRLASKTETLEDVMRSFDQVVEQRDSFRARAINLCKEKAAEWQTLYETDVTGDHDDKVYMARAANQLREALEHLDHQGE